MDLTKRQQEIFDFIKRYSAKQGYPPTVRDIGKAVGLASSSTVHQHLANLERIGMLRRDPSKPRAIELLDRAVQEVRKVVRPDGLPLPTLAPFTSNVAAAAAGRRGGCGFAVGYSHALGALRGDGLFRNHPGRLCRMLRMSGECR